MGYEEEYFPGMVKQRKGRPTKLEVSTMNMCAGANGLNWKWPEVEDKYGTSRAKYKK